MYIVSVLETLNPVFGWRENVSISRVFMPNSLFPRVLFLFSVPSGVAQLSVLCFLIQS